jgi:TRAP-type C4-dicarboxylate transport system permease large subunit
MLRTTALIIGAMTTDVFGTALLKAPTKQETAKKKKVDPCATAMLTAANSVDEDIDLPIGQKVFVSSKISSTPSCPF